MKKVTYTVSFLMACIMVGLGIGVVYMSNNLLPTEMSLPVVDAEGQIVLIEDEATAYGAQAELIGPVAGQAKATSAIVKYDNGAISVQYYSSTASTCQIKFSLNGKTQTINGYPADNSTLRIPLTMGQGTYTVTIYEMIGGNNAKAVSTHTVSTTGASSSSTATAQPSTSSGASSSGWNVDTSDPYLTPVTDINWSDSLSSVKKARELCTTSMSDKEKAVAVYNYLAGVLSYDYDKVGKLSSGYTPSMDTTYSTKKGICYDFSSLYAGMMRSVGVKCKIVKGYNSMIDGYHAWNSVLVDGAWHRVDLTIDSQLREYKKTYSFSSPQGTVTETSSY